MNHDRIAPMTLSTPTFVPLSVRIQTIEDAVRRKPAAADLRWELFQWLCVDQQWERAIQQLRAYAQMEPTGATTAYACRDLIRAECWRENVLAGTVAPGHVIDTLPLWIHGMHTALELAAQGKIEAADAQREQALDAAPSVNGKTTDSSFDWIADSDSRLGPVCEIITAGSYRWLSFADIAAWRIMPPSTPLDLVWAACELTLLDGTLLRGFMPARYPDSGSAESGERDTLLMGRQTVWREVGRTGVLASGHKTWMTSEQDYGLFDISECVFGERARDQAVGTL